MCINSNYTDLKTWSNTILIFERKLEEWWIDKKIIRLQKVKGKYGLINRNLKKKTEIYIDMDPFYKRLKFILIPLSNIQLIY